MIFPVSIKIFQIYKKNVELHCIFANISAKIEIKPTKYTLIATFALSPSFFYKASARTITGLSGKIVGIGREMQITEILTDCVSVGGKAYPRLLPEWKGDWFVKHLKRVKHLNTRILFRFGPIFGPNRNKTPGTPLMGLHT